MSAFDEFDNEEAEPNWLNNRFPPNQLTRFQNTQLRASIRLVSVILSVLLLLIPAYYLNIQVIDQFQSPDFLWILTGILPGIVAVLAVLVMGGSFVKDAYGLSSIRKGFNYARLCLFGVYWPKKYPLVIVEGGKYPTGDKYLADRRLGGPGRMMIDKDSAVVLERYGRISRIEGPGLIFMGRSERIYQVFDLRPQIKSTADAVVYTRDGIALKTTITARVQLKSAPPTPDSPYPVDIESLHKAIGANARRWLSINSKSVADLNWVDRSVGAPDGTLRAIVAEMTLDDIFTPTNPARDPRDEITRRLFADMQRGAEGFGAVILDVMMAPLTPVDPIVERQHRVSWLAGKNARSRIEDAHTDAYELLTRQTAYAYAQREMIQAIDQGFEKLTNQSNGKIVPSQFIALRFVEIVRKIATSPMMGTYLPVEALRTLDYMKQVIITDNNPPALLEGQPAANKDDKNHDSTDEDSG